MYSTLEAGVSSAQTVSERGKFRAGGESEYWNLPGVCVQATGTGGFQLQATIRDETRLRGIQHGAIVSSRTAKNLG